MGVSRKLIHTVTQQRLARADAILFDFLLCKNLVGERWTTSVKINSIAFKQYNILFYIFNFNLVLFVSEFQPHAAKRNTSSKQM